MVEYLFGSRCFGQNTHIRVLDTWEEICIFASGLRREPSSDFRLNRLCQNNLKEYNMKTRFFSTIFVLSLLFLAACNKPDNEKDADAVTLTDVDVSAYDQWVYLSFESGAPIALNVNEEAPVEWDIALHRENVKTNQGAALKSDAVSLSALSELPTGEFVSDVMTDSTLIVDLSQMMQGILIYQKSEINPVLNAWVKYSGMPPVYTLNDNVYVVRNKEGRYAKIKFSSYKNAEDKTGFATLSYIYPAFE